VAPGAPATYFRPHWLGGPARAATADPSRHPAKLCQGLPTRHGRGRAPHLRLQKSPRALHSPTPSRQTTASRGRICEAGHATEGRLLEAKGSLFTLKNLLADDDLAVRLAGGAYVVIYLSPRDYHRVHFPVSGQIVSWRHIPGRLFPVGNRSVRREPGLFALNERFVTVVDGPAGRGAGVMVAAVGVGHITASFDPDVATHKFGFLSNGLRQRAFDSPPYIARGQELGIFNLGSTTVTIFEPGRVELRDLVSGAPIKMGAPLGRVVPM
jgi:phosphatidylserine decarboxylase